MADSLEDDFAQSDAESIGSQNGAEGRSDGGPSDDGERVVKKRQHQGVETEETEEEKRARKKRKMREQDKIRKAKKAANRSALGPGQVSVMPPDMQADHLLSMIKSCKRFSKMTDLELDEIGIKESMLLDTTSIKLERTEAVLPNFIEAALPSAKESLAELAAAQPSMEGQPVLLMITGNAQRAADLAKSLRKMSPKSIKDQKQALPVGKLFARHFKVAEQEAFLKDNVCPIAVGTPQRIHDLLGNGAGKRAALGLSSVKAIVLDASWTDMKMRTLLDNAETKEALCTLLTCDEVQAILKASAKKDKAAVVLF